MHDYIPSRANLHRRHIDPLSICDTCGAHEETTFHALTECTYARQFWFRLRELTGVKLPNLTPDSWTMELLEDRICGEKNRALILCGMWSIWRSRNDRRHGKIPIDMGAAINWALDVCYHLITVNESSDVPISRLPTQRWQRPPSNTLKVNIDAAFVAETNAGAIGAVARDDAGDFLMAM